MSETSVAFRPRLPLHSLWVSMQLIESCRHCADVVEAVAQRSPRRHHELAAIADHWRACADHIQLLHETHDVG